MSKRTAVIIYGWLVVLTLVEVLIVWGGVPKNSGVILMAGTTIGKTLMIGLFFMHIKHDRPIAWLLPGIPILLALAFVAALFPDLVYHLPLRYH